MHSSSITSKKEWKAWADSVVSGPGMSLDPKHYRHYQVALEVLQQPKPEFVPDSEFKDLKDRVCNSLGAIRSAIAMNFVNAAMTLGLDQKYIRSMEFNPFEIAKGQLDLSKKLQGLSEERKQSILEAVSKLEFLTTLNISDNGLTSISESLENLVNLCELDVSNNPELEALPDSLGKLPKMTVLNVANTKIPPLD